MMFCLLNNDLDVIIGEHNIEHVQNKKVLGIIIHDQLKWDKHNDEQCKTNINVWTISKSIALLKRAWKFVPKETIITMYNALVLPHFNYCSTIWHDGNKNHMLNIV